MQIESEEWYILRVRGMVRLWVRRHNQVTVMTSGKVRETKQS